VFVLFFCAGARFADNKDDYQNNDNSNNNSSSGSRGYRDHPPEKTGERSR